MSDAVVPVRFDPSMEHISPHEAETHAALIDTLRSISETTFAHSGHATRAVHAKGHGLLRGKVTVLPGLPPHLAQGLFAKPGEYPAVLRFSTIPGDVLDDHVSTPRGLAVKVIGVDGDRLPGSENDTTQDFVLINGPAFGAPTAEAFLGNLKLVAATTDRAEGLKKIVSAIARTTEAVLEAFGHKSPTVLTLGGQPLTHILGETFYSQAPILYGDYIAKIAVAPVARRLTALTGQHLDMSGKPNALRQAVEEFFDLNDAEWEIRVQLCTDLKTMPIEDASVVWPEDQSPYVAVARITAPSQDAWSAEAVEAIDDGMAFSPWHGLAAHRPLGSIMRARRLTYASSAAFRATHNGCPLREPR
ncbi:MAG: catalase family protein [Rhodopila sp.]|jgi:hypothetical protein